MSAHAKPYYIGAPEFARLSLACIPIERGFGVGVFLVGSCLERADYRDVDVRCVLYDEEFAAIFGVSKDAHSWLNARFAIICGSISLHLQQATGLPIDFQFQSMTEAAKYVGKRNVLGLLIVEPGTMKPKPYDLRTLEMVLALFDREMELLGSTPERRPRHWAPGTVHRRAQVIRLRGAIKRHAAKAGKS